MSSEKLSGEQKKANLEDLNERERRIAYLRIVKGLTIPEMADIFKRDPKTVRGYQTEMYRKLEITGNRPQDSIEALERDYGYLIKSFSSEEAFVNWVRPKQVQPIIRSSMRSETSQPEIPPSVQEIIRRQTRPEPAPPPSPVPTMPQINWMVVVGIGVILIIAWVVISNRNQTPSSTVHGTQVSEKSTPLASAIINTLPPSLTPAPRKTLKPTNTKIPTKTFTPSITPTPYSLPFVDEFDTGIRPEWKISGENPYVVDKSLTVIGTTTLGLGLGETSLKDYIVDFQAEKWSGVDNYIGIRALNENNMIAIKNDDAMFTEYFVFMVENGIWTKIPGSSIDGCVTKNIHFSIKITKNILLITYEDGCFHTTRELVLPEPYRKTGGVLLKANNTEDPYNTAVVEYIRVHPNPTETNTSALASTPFQLPFVNNFDTGISPEWTIFGDIPNVVDKALITSGSTTMSIGLGDPTLTDYIVDFYAKYWGGYKQFIGVRALDEGNMIAIGPDRDVASGNVFIYLVQNGNWNVIPETRIRTAGFDSVHIVINIKGNRLHVIYEDTHYSYVKEIYLSEPYRKDGGIIFRIQKSGNVWDVVDYIKILPNP